MMLNNVVQAVLVETILDKFKEQKTREFALSDYFPIRMFGKTALMIESIVLALATPEVYSNHQWLIPVAATLVADGIDSGIAYVKNGRNARAHILSELVAKLARQDSSFPVSGSY